METDKNTHSAYLYAMETAQYIFKCFVSETIIFFSLEKTKSKKLISSVLLKIN